MSAILEHPNDIQSSIIASIPNGQPPEQYFNRVHVASLAYKARTVDAEREGWQNPSPLHDPLPKVAAFNASLLPEVLRAWVMDIANRMQCPPDYPAVAALVALSSLIGAKAVVQPKRQDTGVATVWREWLSALPEGVATATDRPAFEALCNYVERQRATRALVSKDMA